METFVDPQTGVELFRECCCPVATGCTCARTIAQIRAERRTKMRHASGRRTTYHREAPSRMPTDLAKVRRMVQAKKREMEAERRQRQAANEGRAVRRQVRNEVAAAFRYAIDHPPPLPYDEALKGRKPEAWCSDGGCPEPYTLALGEIVPRRADGTRVRLPEGDEPPAPYTLALKARRSRDRKDNEN